MSYCVCGGYLGSGGVDSYSGRWCRCANPKIAPMSITTSEFILPTYKDYYEPSEEQKRIDDLETLLRDITKELLEFSSNGKIENIRSRIREVLGE